MADDHASTNVMTDHATEHPGAHAHPPYMRIFFWLAGLTGCELLVPFIFTGSSHGWGLAILILIAIWKILLIIRYFMHLKFDARLLAMVAATPAVLASVMALGLLMDNVF